MEENGSSARPPAEGTTPATPDETLRALLVEIRGLAARVTDMEARIAAAEVAAGDDEPSPVANFIDAARDFVEHVATIAREGIDAFHAGKRGDAQCLLTAAEGMIERSATAIREGHILTDQQAMRYADAGLGFDELLPELHTLAHLIDG